MTSLTIFTPTYNRAYTLPRLYKSLCQQTAQDFEWLVVDDGSTDETQMLFNTWLEEGKIPIRYITKENGGKPSAYNIAAKEAKGELFLCVDSDDYLVDNAVEKVLNNWETTDEYKEYDGKPVIGQLYFKGYQNNTPPPRDRPKTSSNITKYKGNAEFATLLEFYRQHGLQGDTMLVYRTDIVRKYPFPKFEGEKFVPEAFVYDQYDDEGVLHIYKEVLYISEYLPDGYSASIRRVNHDNPRGYEAFIKQRLNKKDIKKDTRLRGLRGLRYRIADTIRYIAIKFVLKDYNRSFRLFTDNEVSGSFLLKLLCLFPGWIFYKKAYK